MPWPWKRNDVVSADFYAVPHEPSGAELVAGGEAARRYTERDVLGLIKQYLTAQSLLHAEHRNLELIDALLEIRNALTVPVIPGRTT